MSKRIQPVGGIPIEEALNDLRLPPLKKGSFNEADRKLLNKERKDVNESIDYLVKVVNPEVCVTEPQREFIGNEILSNEQGRDMDYELMVLMNSFQLDCANCLNGKCKKRDPEKPVPVLPAVKRTSTKKKRIGR